MRLERLTIHDFRGIAHMELDFSPSARTTVLVGINGAGKSSVLEAITFSLAWAMTGFDRNDYFGLTPDDIRVGQEHVWIGGAAEVVLDDCARRRIEWQVEARPPVVNEFLTEDLLLRPDLGERRVVETMLAYYSVDRMVPENYAASAVKARGDSVHLYVRASDYGSFFRWFEEREDLENELIREQPQHRDPELESVRTAIEALLPGFHNLRVRRARGPQGKSTQRSRLVVTKGEQQLELAQLSHGERGLLAMVGDIARRLALTGDAKIEPRLRSGVVLIDEIDLHLHPGWQREVIPRLEATFPNVQFIVTTHSPQVISQLHPDSVRILDNFTVAGPTPHTYGRDTNAILSEIMGVDERPRFASEQLHAIARLMDEQRWPEARAALGRLAEDLGQHDGEVLRLRTMIDVLAEPEAAQ